MTPTTPGLKSPKEEHGKKISHLHQELEITLAAFRELDALLETGSNEKKGRVGNPPEEEGTRTLNPTQATATFAAASEEDLNTNNARTVEGKGEIAAFA
jgi:hypothetical protein